MKKNNRKFRKKEIIQLNLSESCMAKSRCKHCHSSPKYYYYINNNTLWYNPYKIHLSFNTKYVKRFCASYYLHENPKDHHTMIAFKFPNTHNVYRPRLHRTRGSQPVNDRVEFLMCECGLTSWAFSAKAIKYRPELMQRRARHSYPNKII